MLSSQILALLEDVPNFRVGYWMNFAWKVGVESSRLSTCLLVSRINPQT